MTVFPLPNKTLLSIVLLLTAFLTVNAQQDTNGLKPLKILSTVEAYQSSVQADPEKAMIELKTVVPTIIYDLRYATKNNFTGKKLYPKNTHHTFLRKMPANALAEVQKELNEKGLVIKVFDVYRPYAVSKKFWDLIHDDRYVADPAKGSLHNRGLAIDMTLVDAKTGKELEMGTGFDDFTEKAHPDHMQFPADILANRKILRSVMEKNGFEQFPTEWWHYSWPDNRNYETLDIENEVLFPVISAK
ncbi:MAG: M15 family metallopeptidase [Flavitalea sp.]